MYGTGEQSDPSNARAVNDMTGKCRPMANLLNGSLIILICLTGCATYNQTVLKTGMSRNELVWTFGNPDADDRTAPIEKMRYFNRRMTPLSEGYTGNYYIFLSDDKIIEYKITRLYHGDTQCR